MRRRLLRLPAAGLAGTLALVALVAPLVASAVVIITGDGTGNTTPPGDDPGFGNVGIINGFTSAVYLGDRWVLTARHAGTGPTEFLGRTYHTIPGSVVNLENADTVPADLRVFRIYGAPPLPPVVLADTAISNGEDVVCAGHGWIRETGETDWNAAWQEVPPGLPPVVHEGFKRLGARIVRWGRNEVTDTGIDVCFPNVSQCDWRSRTFEMLFDESGGLADEHQAVSGDSGGACWVKRSGTWELVGVMAYSSPAAGQPADTAVYGNGTLPVDVAFYRDAILAATPSTAVPAISTPGLVALGLLLLTGARLAMLRRSPRAGSSAG